MGLFVGQIFQSIVLIVAVASVSPQFLPTIQTEYTPVDFPCLQFGFHKMTQLILQIQGNCIMMQFQGYTALFISMSIPLGLVKNVQLESSPAQDLLADYQAKPLPLIVRYEHNVVGLVATRIPWIVPLLDLQRHWNSKYDPAIDEVVPPQLHSKRMQPDDVSVHFDFCCHAYWSDDE